MAVTLNASTSSGFIQTADTSGTIQLQSNGSTVATAQSTGFQINTYTAGASLITSGTAVASTSGTSIDFTSIPSWVKRITVMFSGVSTNGTSPVQVQIGSGSVTTTGYSVYNAVFGNAPSITITAYTSGFGLYAATAAATYLYTGHLILTNITGNTWVGTAVLNRGDTTAVLNVSGSIALSGAIDRVRITTVNGTDAFDAGNINILYE